MRIDFELENGEENVIITAFLRPPKTSEIDTYRRLIMLNLESRDGQETQNQNELAKIGFQMQEQLFELGKKMIYGVKGDVPEWAKEDCETPKDVILEYCSGELSGAAMQLLEQSFKKAVNKQELEAELEKN